MVAKKHVCQLILLLVPSLITIGLLGYCLLSDQWTQISQTRLARVQELYGDELDDFLASRKSSADALVATDKRRLDAAELRKPIIATTTTSTSSKFKQADDDGDLFSLEDYHNGRVKKRQIKSSSADYSHEDDDYYDYQEEADRDGTGTYDYYADTIKEEKPREMETDAEQETTTISSFPAGPRRDPVTTGAPRSITSKNLAELDYVYVSWLWPLVKRKSLFSRCVEYVPLPLRLSVAYLMRAQKEPIAGQIHYGPGLMAKVGDSSTACPGQIGKTRCLFSGQCVPGEQCDGIVDCPDQSDEQFCQGGKDKCRSVSAHGQSSPLFECDGRCWHAWERCDQQPVCFDMSDELPSEAGCPDERRGSSLRSFARTLFTAPANLSDEWSAPTHSNFPFQLGSPHYDTSNKCFKAYFNFKSASLIRKESLKHLTQQTADNVQETHNIDYHLQLVYTLAFLSALMFCTLGLLSLLCIACFGKLCVQCPFWFYGFFQMLASLSATFGLMTFLYQWFAGKQKALDPTVRLPIEAEFLRLNAELVMLDELGLGFWLAVGATGSSCLAALMSCAVCCRLPSTRHEDKEYKIMQLPPYS